MSLPAVLCLSGHDPTGGAGLQADIETLFRLGCHPMTVVTALTEQDTVDVRAVHPQKPDAFARQARTLIADVRVSAVKIGLLGDAGIALAVVELLDALPGVPVVLDPILAAGGGHPLASRELAAVIVDELLPRVAVLTPNSTEARRLAGCVALDACAAYLLDRGCGRVLITGTHEAGDDVSNRLYGGPEVVTQIVPRLPGTYHGSGCTLAAAAAGFLARGLTVDEAVTRALAFTWAALAAGYVQGRGQLIPNRRVSDGENADTEAGPE